MVKREQLQPGTWILQNMIRHQGDYRILRVNKLSDKMIYFDVVITLRGKSKESLRPGSSRVDSQNLYDMPIGSITHNTGPSSFSVMKKIKQQHKKPIIQTLFKNRMSPQ